MKPLHVAGAAAAVGLGAVLLWPKQRRRRRAKVPDTTGDATPFGKGRTARKKWLWAQLRALPQLTEDQRLFLMLVAHGEGGYSPKAHNDSERETDASRRAWKGVADTLGKCGIDPSRYIIGSGGRFGRLVPYFANDLQDEVPCIAPEKLFDGLHDIPSAIAYAHWLTGRPSWNGKVSGLRGGWGTLNWLDVPPAAKVEKWRRHAEEVGLGRAFLDRKLTRFPGNISEIIDTLRAFNESRGAAIA